MGFIRNFGLALFFAALAIAGAGPAKAIPFFTGTNQTLQIGNLLITNTSCAATAGGTVSCGVATWTAVFDPANGNNGGFDIVITPNSTWTRAAGSAQGSDVYVTFVIQSLNAAGAPTAALKYINGAGAALLGSGTSRAIAGGISVTDTLGNGLGSVAEPFGAASWQTASTNAASPSNSISFAPQSVVFINFDVAPLAIGGGSTITQATVYVAHAPEPGTVAVMLVGLLALTGLRRRFLG